MGKSGAAKYRVGGLMDVLTIGDYTPGVWNGYSDVLEAAGARLENVCGGYLKASPFNEYEHRRNRGFDLLDPPSFDGFLMVGGTMGNYCAPEEMRAFTARFAGKPFISIGPAPKGVNHILIDNERGMRALFDHLIDGHGYRRIAFIGGPEGNIDAKERFGVYKTSLAQRGIPFDPALVFTGDFNEGKGVEAVASFLDKGISFRAVVAANDNMAIGAMKELKRRGLRIPQDVAVAGFDDVLEASSVIPTLTTVRQPIEELGRRAAELLLDWMGGGERPPERMVLPAELVVRRSCGCMSSSEGRAAAAAQAAQAYREIGDAESSAQIETAVAGAFANFSHPPAATAARELAQAFQSSLDGADGDAFASVLSRQLEASIAAGNDASVWQDVLSALLGSLHFSESHRKTCEAAIGLIERSRLVVAETAASILTREMIESKRQALTLMRIGGELVTSFRFEQFTDILRRRLPETGIRSAALFLYEDHADPAKGCRCLFAMRDGQDATADFSGRLLPSGSAAYAGLSVKAGPDSWMLQPLYYRDEHLGFIAMNQGTRAGNVYESFHLQLCGSLEGAALLGRSQAMERSLDKRAKAIEALVAPMLGSLEEIAALAAKHGQDSSRLEAVGSENAKKAQAAEKVALGIQDMLGKANSLAAAIADISGTIDIVALNASIEAAHAGAFGRGFSVIAAEIRKLSDSTKKNVQEIADFLSRTNEGIRVFIGANRELMEAFSGLDEAILRVSGFLSGLMGKLEGIEASSKGILDTMSTDFGDGA